MQKLEWFKSKIGKRIFRNQIECCPTCDRISEEGIIVHDENHSRYLFEIQNDFMADGIDMNYREML